jgi:hypothetical protein
MKELDCSKKIGKKIFIGNNTKRTVNISSILYLESDRNYTTIWFRENKGEINNIDVDNCVLIKGNIESFIEKHYEYLNLMQKINKNEKI